MVKGSWLKRQSSLLRRHLQWEEGVVACTWEEVAVELATYVTNLDTLQSFVPRMELVEEVEVVETVIDAESQDTLRENVRCPRMLEVVVGLEEIVLPLNATIVKKSATLHETVGTRALNDPEVLEEGAAALHHDSETRDLIIATTVGRMDILPGIAKTRVLTMLTDHDERIEVAEEDVDVTWPASSVVKTDTLLVIVEEDVMTEEEEETAPGADLGAEVQGVVAIVVVGADLRDAVATAVVDLDLHRLVTETEAGTEDNMAVCS